MEKLTKFRIWDCGFRKNTENPKSEIPNPKSDVGCRESGISTIFFLLLTLLISQSGLAQTCSQVATATENMTWTGAVSTDWNNPCNWSPNGVPTATNPVRIDDVANDPVISTTVAVPLVIINGGLLTVNSGATLNVTGYDYPSNGSFYGIVLLGGTFTNNGTTTVQPNAGGKIDFPLYAQNLSATFNNNGIFTESASAAGIYSLYSANLTLNNSSTATINLSGDGYGVRTVNGSIALNNLGTINYTGTGYALVLNLGTKYPFENSL